MYKIEDMITEICNQDNDLTLVRTEHIPFEYNEEEDEFTFEKLVVCISAKSKQQIYAMLGDFVENVESVKTNIYTYYLDNKAYGTIELQIME